MTAIANVSGSPASIWRLVARNTKPILRLAEGATPIYCVHAIDGGVGDFRNLAPRLPAGQGFCAIQVPREKMNAAFAESIEGMAATYVDAILEAQPEGPIILAGWSAGALVALEMAQQLDALCREVPLLIAFDGAPCNTGAELPRWDPRSIAGVLANLPRRLREEMREDWSLSNLRHRFERRMGKRHRSDTPDLPAVNTLDTDAIEALLEKKGWLPGQQAFLNAFYAACARYVPRPYAGRVLVFECRVQPLARLRHVADAWRKLAPHAEIIRLPGPHTHMFEGEAGAILVRGLERALSALPSPAPREKVASRSEVG